MQLLLVNLGGSVCSGKDGSISAESPRRIYYFLLVYKVGSPHSCQIISKFESLNVTYGGDSADIDPPFPLQTDPPKLTNKSCI